METILNIVCLLKYAIDLHVDIEISEATDSETGDSDIFLPCPFETVVPVIGQMFKKYLEEGKIQQRGKMGRMERHLRGQSIHSF